MAANVEAEAAAAVTVVTVVVAVVDVAILATVKGAIVDVAMASEDAEIVANEANTVVAAVDAVVVRVRKVQLLPSAMRMPSHLLAAQRSDHIPRFNSNNRRW